jgi:hypothetical protein
MSARDADTLVELFLLSGVIAFGFLVAVAFYESLCKRDVLVARVTGIARRRSDSPWVHGAAYALAVGVGIPALVILWTLTLELALLVVGSVEWFGNVALIATAIVAAARILAYVREKTSHELAKAIPLALAFVLLTSGVSKLDDNLRAVVEDPSRSELTTTMMVFLIALEIGLRVMTDGSHRILAAIRHRRGIEGDTGVWRTLWAALRPPGDLG